MNEVVSVIVERAMDETETEQGSDGDGERTGEVPVLLVVSHSSSKIREVWAHQCRPSGKVLLGIMTVKQPAMSTIEAASGK